jgi:hypothetical protein
VVRSAERGERREERERRERGEREEGAPVLQPGYTNPQYRRHVHASEWKKAAVPWFWDLAL